MKYQLNFDNHSDFKVIEKNRLAPRAYFIPDVSKKAKATAGFNTERYESSMVKLLSGSWDFKYYKSKNKMPREIDTDKINFDTVSVPSTWQRTGYEPPVYLNCPYGFTGTGVTPPVLPDDFSAGVYRKSFEVHDTSVKRIITFLGVVPCIDLYINGSFVGYGEAAHNSYEFDITPYLREGENELVAVLFKWCSGSYLEAQDMFRENGIFRDVYITEYANAYINDFEIKTEKKGKLYNLSGKIMICGEADGCKAEISLLDGKKSIAETTVNAEDITDFSFEGLNVTQWNAEQPYLYELYITLVKGNKQIMSLRSFTGFRTIKIKENVFTYNGKKIKLKGVNHHDTHETKGYAMSIDDMEKDVMLMKEYNVNCVRTSHYPPDPQFLAFCDKYGLYVVDEADIETHGLHDLGLNIDDISMDLKWASRYLDRVKRMYYRDRNRPCVLMWSLGNESGGYRCQDKCYEYLHEVCPEIPVHYEGVSRTKRYHYDVYSEMYTHPFDVEKVGKGTRDKRYTSVPFYLCEYCHAMGVGPGALEEYWDIFYAYDNLMGGCIWEWADHSVKHSKKDNKYKYEYTYGGDHGEKKHDGNFCVDGLFYPDRTPHTGALEMKNVYRPLRASLVSGKTFSFLNTNRFRNSDYIEIYWQLKKDGRVDGCGSFVLDIEPQKSRKITIPFNTEKGHTYHIDFTYMEGSHEIAFEQVALESASLAFEKPSTGKISVTSDGGILTAKFESGHVSFDEKTGFMTAYSAGGKNLIEKGSCIVPNLYRAPLDNDAINRDNWKKYQLHKPVFKLRELEAEIKNGELEIESDFQVFGGKVHLFDCELVYKIGANGVLELNASLTVPEDADEEVYDIARFGIYLAMPKAYSNVRYFGRGPAENLPDFKAQSSVGVYSAKVSDMHEDYIKPQDNGCHCATRSLTITDNNGNGISFLSDSGFCFNAHDYSRELLHNARHREDIRSEGATFVMVDGFIRGTGTASCGPDTLDKYRINAGEKLSFSLYISPIK